MTLRSINLYFGYLCPAKAGFSIAEEEEENGYRGGEHILCHPSSRLSFFICKVGIKTLPTTLDKSDIVGEVLGTLCVLNKYEQLFVEYKHITYCKLPPHIHSQLLPFSYTIL